MFENLGVLNFWTYLAGLVLIIIVPGPNSLYVLKSSTSHGTKAGYRAAIGVFTGDAILIFLSFIGVASVIKASPTLFMIVRYLGAAYLLYLGCKILYATFWQKKALSADMEHIEIKKENHFTRALVLSLTNPKAILFYISFFIQFIDFNYSHAWIPYMVLAVILETVSFLYLSLLIFSGYLIARFLREKQILAKLGNCTVGAFFMGFAAKLAIFSN
ncbi:leucine efflux protein LeuE [Providencia alcalifaciens]|uniref:leucine efflux protein LeuE n=1 Tax=Providencia alcalifaciens TaxID=126385 RepID=UPI0004491077|nr:leucine efflux protein LeuE [Providencia alcalifaciens]ETT06506.1 leucine efflux protein [Providencia alcalifaciens F90-2004]EUC94017.1 leucine efflux protein [Providencia alcalifaciens PAL-2]MTB34390.1 leucine efflux protein LeuE [Providencia alcalifaciens]MTC26049.1 leucine efflux protein LeuE [Providencia alcalifaciens]MTC26269.1 leucine efflux protein LeuE [Providencia alcalifaciens]